MKGNLAYDVVSNFRKNWQRPWQYFSYDEVNEVYEEHTSSYWPTATLREYQTRTSNLTVNAAINYNREFNGHNVSAMVGFEQNQFRKDYMSASRLKVRVGTPSMNYSPATLTRITTTTTAMRPRPARRRLFRGVSAMTTGANISCR